MDEATRNFALSTAIGARDKRIAELKGEVARLNSLVDRMPHSLNGPCVRCDEDEARAALGAL